jgi:hypothetical protein
MSVFTAPFRKHAVAFAGIGIAALSLTACNGVGGVTVQGTAVRSTTQPAQPDAAASDVTARVTDSSARHTQPARSTGSSAATSGTGSSSDKHVVCTGANLKVTAQQVSRPLNYTLLTATNTGSRTCDLYYYPAVQFEDAQSAPPVFEDTQPQAVTTLAPGESGYAGVMRAAADGSGSNGYTAKTLDVYFFGRAGDGNGSVGKGAKVALPGKGVYIDDSIHVTYWVTEPQDALS